MVQARPEGLLPCSSSGQRRLHAFRRGLAPRGVYSRLRVGGSRGPCFRLGRDFGPACRPPIATIAATLEKGRRARAGTSRAAAARRAGSSRPTRGGPRTFLYRRSPCAGGAALRGGSGLRRVALIYGSLIRHRRDSRDAGAARSSNFELRAILLEFSQSRGLKEHSRGFSFCRASALRARRDESLPCLLTNSWKSIEGPPMVCCFGLGGGLCVVLSSRHRRVSPCPCPAAPPTPSRRRVPHAIDATRLWQQDAGHARRRRRLRGQTLRHLHGRPGPGLLHVRGDALDLRLPHLTPSPRC